MPKAYETAPIGRKETLRRYRSSVKGQATERAWRERNKESRLRRVRERRLERMYGLSESERHRILALQEGSCAICNRPESALKRRLAVDHCHEHGRVRGLLCFDCNSGIGKLKDDPSLLRRAISYLEVPLAPCV